MWATAGVFFWLNLCHFHSISDFNVAFLSIEFSPVDRIVNQNSALMEAVIRDGRSKRADFYFTHTILFSAIDFM